MPSLPVLGREPEYPTASEIARAAECVAPWALGLERRDEAGAAAAWGSLCHAGAEALARGCDLSDHMAAAFDAGLTTPQNVLRLRATLEHVRMALVEDWEVIALNVEPLVEQGVAWRPWARTARLVERVPGQRFRGEFSGTADLVYLRGDGVLVVADWKFGEGAARLGDGAEDHPQLWTLALGFATALGHAGPVRVEVRHVGEEGARVDGADLTAGDLAAWARELEVLAAKINAGQAALPRRSHACGRCSARAACPSWDELAEAIRDELAFAGSTAGVLVRPPRSPDDVRLLSDAIEVADRWAGQAREWRKGYILTHPPVPVGLGLELAPIERKARSVLTTPEALAAIERVAPGAVVEEVRRKATVTSIRAAARAVGEDVKSTADRKRAKDAEEARVFGELVAAGAVREKGSVWAVGLRRSDGAVEVLDRVEEGEEVE